jgi:hypothetical protein
MAAKPTARTRRDRWADWAVIGVLVVALLLGWGVKAVAEGQRTTYTDDETGLTVRYPKGWLLKSDDKLAFQAIDPGSGDFKTTYQVRVYPIDATANVTSTLSMVLNNASLARAQKTTAYRLFDIVEGDEIGDQPTMEATYAFVVEGSDLFVQRMPVVVQGLDVAVAQGDMAYVFSLLAADSAFEDAEKTFRRFIETAEGQ